MSYPLKYRNWKRSRTVLHHKAYQRGTYQEVLDTTDEYQKKLCGVDLICLQSHGVCALFSIDLASSTDRKSHRIQSGHCLFRISEQMKFLPQPTQPGPPRWTRGWSSPSPSAIELSGPIKRKRSSAAALRAGPLPTRSHGTGPVSRRVSSTSPRSRATRRSRRAARQRRRGCALSPASGSGALPVAGRVLLGVVFAARERGATCR